MRAGRLSSRVLRRVALLVLGLTGVTWGPAPPAAAAGPGPIGMHSMLQLTDPYSFMQAMFAQAAAMNASAIRLDVAPALVFGVDRDQPDFRGVDEIVGLAQRYHLEVVGDLTTIPWWLANCQSPTDVSQMDLCGTNDLTDYASMIRQIVARAGSAIRLWEVWNEPDSVQFFTGSPAQYAAMLRTAHDAIKAVDPADQVLLGGISSPASMPWLAQVFATPGDDAVRAFDIANIHERAPLAGLAGDVAAWRRFLNSQGFTGPLWVTEHGYPSDPAFQYDPGFGSGPAAQAAYLRASIPTLLDAGAARVFITERDNLSGPFASEGVLGGDVADPPPGDPQVIEKPAYSAVRTLAACYLTTGRDCPQPPPVFAPTSEVLPVTRLGTTATVTVAVSDPGAEPAVLGRATVAGPGASRLAITHDGCAEQILEPAGTCPVSLRYTPAVGARVAAHLTTGSDDGVINQSVTVAPTTAADLSPPPAGHLVFRPTRAADGVGYPQALAVTITNRLPVPVAIRRVRLVGSAQAPFSVAGQRCASRRLVPEQRCSIAVRFRPRRPGTATAVLSVHGEGPPLQIALAATAFPRPAIIRLAGPEAGGCHTGRKVLALVDQPATLVWRIAAYAPGTRGCGTTPTAGMTLVGASGRARTTARPVRFDGADGFLAQLDTARGMDGDRLPAGRFLVRVTPVDKHGVGTTRTIRVSVSP